MFLILLSWTFLHLQFYALCITDTVMVHVTVNSIDTHHSRHIPATAKDVKPVIGKELNEGKCYATDVVIMNV